jgi:phasin family protein
MANPTFDFFNEYNSKVLETMRSLGDLNVATAQQFINKQVELTNSIMEASLASGKEIAAAKTPVEAAQVSSALIQGLTDTVSSFVKESAADAVKARDELKGVIDSSVSLNTEYAGKAFENGVETAKKAASKAR